jgi:hypothetical protein
MDILEEEEKNPHLFNLNYTNTLSNINGNEIMEMKKLLFKTLE